MNVAICEDEAVYASGMQEAVQTWARAREDAGV